MEKGHKAGIGCMKAVRRSVYWRPARETVSIRKVKLIGSGKGGQWLATRNWRRSSTNWNASSAHDKAFAEIVNAIHQLMAPSEPNKNRPIGFAPWRK
jgi:hypothetical protein